MGIWRQGRCHHNHKVNKHDVKRTDPHTYTHCTRTPTAPLHSQAHIQGPHHRAPCNVHSHMHKRAHKHKHAHYATRSQTLLVCVWNERRVVRKTARLKKEPCPASGTNTTQSRDSVAFSPTSVCLSVPIFSLSHFKITYFAQAS